MKTNNSIKLNLVTYNAVMELLSSKNGVDITPILNDLQGCNSAAALNAGLLMAGKKLELPYKVAYSVEYNGTIVEWQVESVSFITNRIGGKYIEHRWDKETQTYNTSREFNFSDKEIEEFLSYEPSLEIAQTESAAKIEERNK